MPTLITSSSRVYPTATSTRRRFAASDCIREKLAQGRGSTLNWCFGWWQVLGSNQRRLSRRFYRALPAPF
jgi:hypothetical protein